MDEAMTAYCGAYCGVCDWKERTGCGGCQACAGEMFWGQCDKAKCCMERGYTHCGLCPDLPCERMQALIRDPEHGDTGGRLRNLRNWAAGRMVYEALVSPMEAEAREKGAE